MIVLRPSPYLKLLLINITLWAPVHAHERRKIRKRKKYIPRAGLKPATFRLEV